MSSRTPRGLVAELRREAWNYYEKQEGHPNIFPYHVKMRAALLMEEAAAKHLDSEFSAAEMSDIKKVLIELAYYQHGPEPTPADIELIRLFLYT